MISLVIYITYHVYGFRLGVTVNHWCFMENFGEEKIDYDITDNYCYLLPKSKSLNKT